MTLVQARSGHKFVHCYITRKPPKNPIYLKCIISWLANCDALFYDYCYAKVKYKLAFPVKLYSMFD